MTEEEVLGYVSATITSVWALQALILLRTDPRRAWPKNLLVRELRGSHLAIDEALTSLRNAGLVVQDSEGMFRLAPASADLGEFVDNVAEVYATKPVSVIRSIANSANEKLRIFSNAFRFKE